MERKYTNGLYARKPHPNAPEFIKLNISINREMFLKDLSEAPADEKGYVRIDVLKNKEGSKFDYSFQYNTYNANQGNGERRIRSAQESQEVRDEIDSIEYPSEDTPF